MTKLAKEIKRVLDCPNVSYNGIHLPTLARLARDLNHPTTDRFAEYVWRLSNVPTLPGDYAARFMRAAGYEPFVGFPLRPIVDVPTTETAASGALPKELQLTFKPEDIAYPHGLSIRVEGFKGDIGHAAPSQIFVELYEGRLRVHVWDGGEDPVSSTTIDRA